MILETTPSGWLNPSLVTFKDAEKVHFSRVPGRTLTDDEIKSDLEGTVTWHLDMFSHETTVVDKNGVPHASTPLFKKLA